MKKLLASGKLNGTKQTPKADKELKLLDGKSNSINYKK